MPATLLQSSSNRELFTRERRRVRMQNFLHTLENAPVRGPFQPETFAAAKTSDRVDSAHRTALSAGR